MSQLVSTVAPNVPVQVTRTLYNFKRQGLAPHELMEIFDNHSLDSIRLFALEELILKVNLLPDGDTLLWFEERIKAYSYINNEDNRNETWTDFQTVFMLLRTLLKPFHWRVGNEVKQRVFDIILDVLELALKSPYDNYDKEATVIFCGFLKNVPESYNERARSLIRDTLRVSLDFGSRSNFGIHLRLINIVGMLRDTALLPEIREHILPVHHVADKHKGLDSSFKYFSGTEEKRAMDGAARQVVMFLEAIENGTVPQEG